jgi:hypothetical protein
VIEHASEHRPVAADSKGNPETIRARGSPEKRRGKVPQGRRRGRKEGLDRGIPKEIYQLWKDYLQPRGYKIAYQIVDFPGGMPGDIRVTLSWG